MKLSRKQQASRNPGYSLVELLLTTSLLLIFAGLAVVSMETLNQGSTFGEGTIRFETMVRFAHAEAARTGRRVRIDFVQETNDVANLSGTNQLSQVHLSWEPNPASDPDVFQDLLAPRWGVDQVNDALRVADVRVLDGQDDPPDPLDDSPADLNAPTPVPPTDPSLDAGMAPVPLSPSSITFNPDGSCDAAEITLVGIHPDEDRSVTLRVDGTTGAISHKTPPAKVDDLGTPAGGTNRPPTSSDNKPSR